jgi:hypothetical protein
MLTHTARILRFVGIAALASLTLVHAEPAAAQRKPVAQYMFSHQSPPGTVGQMRLQRGGPVVGYYQPVQITGPKDVLISMADQGDWTDPVDGALFAGMQIGVPYRLKLANLPEQFRIFECYPTIEIIDRTYAPVGLERRFPIPIVFDEDDLRLATEGLLVTRVVYVEDPQQALPGAQAPGEQLWHDAGPKANALEVADGLGRPVAIVRLGGRTPDESAGPDMHFLYGCPKFLRILPPPVISELPHAPGAQPMPAQAIPTQQRPAQPSPTLQPTPAPPQPTVAPAPLQNSSSRRAAAR